MAGTFMCSRLAFMNKINDQQTLALLIYDFFFKTCVFLFFEISNTDSIYTDHIHPQLLFSNFT